MTRYSELSDLLRDARARGYSRAQRHHLAVNYREAADEFNSAHCYVILGHKEEYFSERHVHCMEKIAGWYERHKPEAVR